MFTILIGMLITLINSSFSRNDNFQAGIKFTSKKILQWAVVILGFSLNLGTIAKVGTQSLPVIVCTISTALITAFIMMKLLKIDSKVATLIGVGSSICGGSAIAATAPVIEADDEEVAQAYCSHVYNLFDGITFERPKSKEKQLIVEQKNKAKSLLAAYDDAKLAVDNLDEALMYFASAIKDVGIVKHKMYGDCEVITVDPRYLKIRIVKSGEEKQLGLAIVIANGIISLDNDEFKEKKDQYLPLLKKADSVPRTLEYAARALEPYKEYLE